MMVPPTLWSRFLHIADMPAADKAALRSQFRRARREFADSLLPADRETLERRLAANTAPLLASVAIVASYAAYGAEIDPRFIAGDRLAFPRIAGTALSFHHTGRASLAPGRAGIDEPPASAPVAVPDIVLVPLVAVTFAGTRLGQGGGYYDRSLRDLRSQRSITAIGLAWDVQIAAALPVDPWDERLDFVATPTRLVRCADQR